MKIVFNLGACSFATYRRCLAHCYLCLDLVSPVCVLVLLSAQAVYLSAEVSLSFLLLTLSDYHHSLLCCAVQAWADYGWCIFQL